MWLFRRTAYFHIDRSKSTCHPLRTTELLRLSLHSPLISTQQNLNSKKAEYSCRRIPMDSSLPPHAVSLNPKPKRPCPSPDPTRIPHPDADTDQLDALLESLLELPDPSAVALDLSIDRIIESRLYDFDKNDVIERALRLGSALTEAAKRSARRRASVHNAVVWALPSDLTVKVLCSLTDRI